MDPVSKIDRISSRLMERMADGSTPISTKRSATPPEGDSPSKRHLPETRPPNFDVDLFRTIMPSAVPGPSSAVAEEDIHHSASSSISPPQPQNSPELEAQPTDSNPLQAEVQEAVASASTSAADTVVGQATDSNAVKAEEIVQAEAADPRMPVGEYVGRCSGLISAKKKKATPKKNKVKKEEEASTSSASAPVPNSAPTSAFAVAYNSALEAAAAARAKDRDPSMSDSESGSTSAELVSVTGHTDTLVAFMKRVNRNGGRFREDDTVCIVPGRCSLLSQGSKYHVSVAELRRRLSPPETLNASLLGGILRRAKSKNGGKVLRDAIILLGMDMPVGRRKLARMTLFTSLTEGEATTMATDFSSLCQHDFPVQSMAKALSDRYKQKSEMDEKKKQEKIHKIYAAKSDAINILHKKQEKIHKIYAAKECVNEFLSVLNSVRKPPAENASEGEQRQWKELHSFDLLTHFFGNSAIVTALETFMRYLEVYGIQLQQGSSAVMMAPPSALTIPSPSATPAGSLSMATSTCGSAAGAISHATTPTMMAALNTAPSRSAGREESSTSNTATRPAAAQAVESQLNGNASFCAPPTRPVPEPRPSPEEIYSALMRVMQERAPMQQSPQQTLFQRTMDIQLFLSMMNQQQPPNQ